MELKFLVVILSSLCAGDEIPGLGWDRAVPWEGNLSLNIPKSQFISLFSQGFSLQACQENQQQHQALPGATNNFRQSRLCLASLHSSDLIPVPSAP